MVAAAGFEPAVFGLTPRAQIWGLVVDENHRRRGIAKALVGHAEQWAKSEWHMTHIEVGSNQSREESHAFYRGLN